jgi:Mlc titration factor MtfA (ptsG expression regulator)
LISWSAARHDLRRLGTGRNVVIHEFAHKLDLLDGILDGTPPLDGEALGLPSAVCDCEMLASCAAAAAGNPSTAIRTPNQ